MKCWDWERWDWGEIAMEGLWLENVPAYQCYVNQMHWPWFFIQLSEEPYPISEMISHYGSKRIINTEIWDLIDEYLRLKGWEKSCANMNFRAVVRTKTSYSSLQLTNIVLPGALVGFLNIRITDKPTLKEAFKEQLHRR